MMIEVGGVKVARVSVEGLLGRPLNSYEKRFAPSKLFVAGRLPIPLKVQRVAVVGTRQPTSRAVEFTKQVVKDLVREKVAVVSGLARGVDTVAHKTAIENGGKTIAVLGTPLNRFYPPENRELQLTIMREHLAVSQFPPNHVTHPRDFILRNRTMALISDASIIVEAGETSGALSQGWEAIRLGRPLYIAPFMLEQNLDWPKKMIEYGAKIFEDVDDLVGLLPNHEYELSSILER
ncbi:MAG: DNA-processing protein DprA [Candidatus Caldarchaeum sp.]